MVSAGQSVPRDESASPGGASRVPDFFIVGHQKCGTTALYLMLKQHPQIFMSEVKEPRFFASDQWSRIAREPPASRPRTLEAYLALFADARAEKRVGEASPHYLRSSVAAKAIAEVQPDARIIAILREPASFLRSFHLQMVSSDVETETDFARALALEPERREGRRIPRGCHHPEALLYSDHVRYVEQLRRYLDVFGKERVKVLIYDDFRADNDATVRDVLRFLDVDDDFEVPDVQTGPVSAVRSVRLHRLANAARSARWNPRAAGPVGKALGALTPAPLRSDALRGVWRRAVYDTPQPPDRELMAELRARFRPEVVALGEHLGRDLVTQWGYDSDG